MHYKERLGLQVCASKVYTSAEFKREKDNFQSLCKNLERTETKRLDEDLGDDEDEDFDDFVNKSRPHHGEYQDEDDFVEKDEDDIKICFRWLTETLETLMKERAADEQKAESQKLKQVEQCSQR